MLDARPGAWAYAAIAMPSTTTTIALAAVALALVACEGDPPPQPAPADAVPSSSPVSTAPPPGADRAGPPAAKPTSGPRAKTKPEGGLALGERFAAFEILNCESGKVYCQVCHYGSNPKIMAVGTLGDPGFEANLQQLEALVEKYGADAVKAFAVVAVADPDEGALVTPMGDTEALVAGAKALKQKLALSFPIVIPAAQDAKPNAVFEDYYAIASSRTIMFADRDNRVRYSAVAPETLAGLDAAITDSLGR